jgi:hypothetical protein
MKWLTFALVCVVAVAVVGCGPDEGKKAKQAGSERSGTSAADVVNADRPPSGLPSDFFPMSTGTTWKYQIRLGDMQPLNYEVVKWPQGERERAIATRGLFFRAVKDEAVKDYVLQIRVKGPATQQRNLGYPTTDAELEIMRDDLGVFVSAKRVFYAAKIGGQYMAHLIMVHGANSIGLPPAGAWGGWGGEDGYSARLVMFGGEPYTAISLGLNDTDSLEFIGSEMEPTTQRLSLHFRRMVKANKHSSDVPDSIGSSELDDAFTEDMWFTKHRGLERLVQTRRNKVTMTWTLSEFSP